MPLPLSDTHKVRIVHHIEAGLIDARIAELEHCHPSTVSKIRSHWQAFGQHTAPAEIKNKPGPMPKLIPAAVHSMIEFSEARPGTQLNELQDFLFNEWGVSVSKGVVSRTLKKHKISQKELRRIAQERQQGV